ncbi:MAG: O-antigen ligase family protein [Rugosibacter sp.]|nr:O-antigen ligase family protein [Rugosibacter sp.]MDO9273673.1 O-antigen ligase family protein [Rugosibacter sp.]
MTLALVLGLLFTWSLPDVPALRYWLLFLSLLGVARLTSWQSLPPVWRANRWVFGLLAAFTLWLVWQAVFISHQTLWALKELKGQWLNALLALGLGVLLACASREKKLWSGAIITTTLIGVWVLQAMIAVGQSVAHWWLHGELLRGLVPLTGGKLEMSFILNMLLAALTVDLLFRACHARRFLQLPWKVVIGAAAISLTSLYLAGARNGVIGLLFLAVSASLLYSIHRIRQQGVRRGMLGGAMLLALVMSLAVISYQADNRWPAFMESTALGWDIDGQRAWMDIDHAPLPVMKSGVAVDASAYIRVAFIHAGLRLIEELPLGVGYGRNAFSHALRETGVDAQVGHAHSGWIDLGIGAGIPAVVLWLLFMGSLMVTGGVRYFRDQNPHGLWLLFLASGFIGRMVVDSVNRDHMLQIFLFLAGYLLAMSIRDDQWRVT